jgi:integrase
LHTEKTTVARTVRDAALETRTARGKLDPSGQPYYRNLEPGLLHLGYRKPRAGAGKWLARIYTGSGTYRLHKIGVADDLSDADGKVILSFKQAQAAARKLMVVQAGGGVGTVGDTVEAYVRSLEADGRPAATIKRTRYSIDAFILPTLGKIELAKLTSERLQDWRDDLARRPARLRTRNGDKQRHRVHSVRGDDRRARRASANRVRVTLVAALNAAFLAGHIGSDLAWRRMKPFKGVDQARARYLSVAEAKRLINAARPEFRPLLQAALLTGARYGQLAQLVVSDVNVDAGTLRLRTRKGDGSERVYYAHLTDEALAFFRATCAGRRGDDLILTHADGEPWGKSHQDIPMEEASERAGISPAVNFHMTRHTFASHAIMNGAPLLVVAQALGHTDTRMVEKHYGHLSPSYAAAAIRKAAPRFGIKPGNVRPLRS